MRAPQSAASIVRSSDHAMPPLTCENTLPVVFAVLVVAGAGGVLARGLGATKAAKRSKRWLNGDRVLGIIGLAIGGTGLLCYCA